MRPPTTHKAKERLLVPAEFTDLKSERRGVSDGMRESWRRMEELWMVGIVGSTEGYAGPNETAKAAKATTKIEVTTQQAMLLYSYYNLHSNIYIKVYIFRNYVGPLLR